MKDYQRAGLHRAELYREGGIAEWGVYKWMMLRARGDETRARWEKQTGGMRNECMAQWGITVKAKWRRGQGRTVQEEALGRGEREEARRGILFCAPMGRKGPPGKVQSTCGLWYQVQADMFRRDNIPGGFRHGDQCWRCTEEAGQVPGRS